MATMEQIIQRNKQKQNILNQYNGQQQINSYQKNKDELAKSRGFTNNMGRIGQSLSKVSNNPKLQAFGKGLYNMSEAGMQDKAYDFLGNLGTKAFGLQGPANSTTGQALKGGVSIASDLDKATEATKSAGNNVAGGIGTGVGAGLGAFNTFSDIKAKNYDDAILDGVSTVAGVIPGGQVVAAGAQVAKLIKNIFKNKKEQKSQEALQKAQKMGQEAEANKMNAMQDMDQPQQPIASSPEELKRSIFDSYNTTLTPGQEADYQITKQASPFANDSGYDYDLRGYFANGGDFNPYSPNGHLSDIYKKPNHPTYGTDWTQKGRMLEVPDSLGQAFELDRNGYDYSKYMDKKPSLNDFTIDDIDKELYRRQMLGAY